MWDGRLGWKFWRRGCSDLWENQVDFITELGGGFGRDASFHFKKSYIWKYWNNVKKCNFGRSNLSATEDINNNKTIKSDVVQPLPPSKAFWVSGGRRRWLLHMGLWLDKSLESKIKSKLSSAIHPGWLTLMVLLRAFLCGHVVTSR